MEKEIREQLVKSLLEEIKHSKTLQHSSDAYAKSIKTVMDLTDRLNSMDRIENEAKAEELKADIESLNASYERDFKEREFELKEKEQAEEKKRSKKEFIGRIVTVAASVGTPFAIAFFETKGLFTKLTNWKPPKF